MDLYSSTTTPPHYLRLVEVISPRQSTEVVSLQGPHPSHSLLYVFIVPRRPHILLARYLYLIRSVVPILPSATGSPSIRSLDLPREYSPQLLTSRLAFRRRIDPLYQATVVDGACPRVQLRTHRQYTPHTHSPPLLALP